MAKDDITMPQSMAGLQRFTSDDPAKIKIKPTTVLIILAVVVVAIIILHITNGSIIGLSGA